MSNSSPMSVEVGLNGYFQSDYEAPNKTIIDVTGQSITPGFLPPMTRKIGDARVLQESEDDGSPQFQRRFLNNHGFVLLEHCSLVENWDSGAFGPSDALQVGDRSEIRHESENEVKTKYLSEVDSLLRDTLFPNRQLYIQQPDMVLRRGKNTAHPFFGLGVHNDYGVSADDFQENLQSFSTPESGDEWRESFEREHVSEFMVINFWRTVHMSRPLEHMPLAVLDSSSIISQDLVSSGLQGFTHTGRITNQLSLKYNDDQSWYFYPNMTTDEVLVLKLFHIAKHDTQPRFGGCFHTAFENPSASPDAEERQSCEHRVYVYVLKD